MKTIPLIKAGYEITPLDFAASYKQHTLTGQTVAGITKALGFAPNVSDDPAKVVNSWAFKANGHECAIWDWKGSETRGEFSAFGPIDVISAILNA